MTIENTDLLKIDDFEMMKLLATKLLAEAEEAFFTACGDEYIEAMFYRKSNFERIVACIKRIEQIEQDYGL